MQGQSARYNAISCGVDGEKGKTGKLKRGWKFKPVHALR